jgi:hypothetical protein
LVTVTLSTGVITTQSYPLPSRGNEGNDNTDGDRKASDQIMLARHPIRGSRSIPTIEMVHQENRRKKRQRILNKLKEMLHKLSWQTLQTSTPPLATEEATTTPDMRSTLASTTTTTATDTTLTIATSAFRPPTSVTSVSTSISNQYELVHLTFNNIDDERVHHEIYHHHFMVLDSGRRQCIPVHVDSSIDIIQSLSSIHDIMHRGPHGCDAESTGAYHYPLDDPNFD